MEVSCVGLRSMITGEDVQQIISCYNLQVVIPYELERTHHTSEGYLTVLEAYLKFGVRFPLHPFFVEILKHFGLTVFQVTPNGSAHMIGLFSLFAEHGIGLPTAAKLS